MQLLLVSPFITIIFSFLLVSGFSDPSQDPKQAALLSANLFTVFVLLGFSLCSGLFIIAPVADKESKMRQMLTFIGMKPLSYYIGSFLADYILFIIPSIGFIVLLFPLGIKLFIMNGTWALLFVVMITFGLSLISVTYLFSFMYNNPNTAFRQIGVIYYLGGTILPITVSSIIAVATFSLDNYKILRYIFFFDPFWNFKDALEYNFISNFAIDFFPDPAKRE